jgi:hypothetical protein
MGCLCFGDWKVGMNLYVVGPQRASNLVYEVARQLGGTAAVAELKTKIVGHDPVYTYKTVQGQSYGPETERTFSHFKREVVEPDGYRLSLPIPPDATVLFVTDRLGPKMVEMVDTVMAVRVSTTPSPVVLSYLLCLVDSRQETGSGLCPVMMDHRPFKIISLHQ